MTYDLFIGDRTFSSWSLRGWLMLDSFGLPYRAHMVGLYAGTMAADLGPVAPARLVPVLRLPDGTVVGESLAIAETLAERHPDIPLWPADPAARATARWICAEMATGFQALRGDCPMQLLHVYQGFDPSAAVRADIDRIEALWSLARSKASASGWLFGAWSLADVFFVPVAARIVGYDLPVTDKMRARCLQMLAHPSVRAWRAQGLTVSYDPVPYALPLKTLPWPIED